MATTLEPRPQSSGNRAAWEKRLKDKATAATDLEERTKRLLQEREETGRGGTGATGTGAGAGAGAGTGEGGVISNGADPVSGLAQAVYDLKRRLADIEAGLYKL
jgi:hypothetical protein